METALMLGTGFEPYLVSVNRVYTLLPMGHRRQKGGRQRQIH